MAPDEFRRKLTAILSADAAGYSRLMSEDEEATVRTMTTYRAAMTRLIQQYRGRVVDSPGDNILAEFGSVVDAVQCAVAAQNEFKARNAELRENRRMMFRIGVNLGDVIEEEGRIYGDGVNIAARLEALADPGGICLSGGVFDQIEGKLPFSHEYMGEQTVKNIRKPVRIYRLLTDTQTEPMVGKPVEAPHKPSIAILPFVNMSGDSRQDFLADGISENIITALSKIPQMFVIARNSSFTYRDRAVKVQEVARELGVRYILEGSVQKAGERVRVTAQLIDAANGYHLWAERYDRSLGDLFSMQDEITLNIVVALQVEMTDGEQARVRHRSSANLDAWGYFVKAYDLFQRHTKEDNIKARELLDQALKLEPNYANALALKAVTHFQDARFEYSASPAESFMSAVELCRMALTLDDTDPDTLALWGIIEMAQGQHEAAIATGERALTLGPSNAEVHAMLGVNYYYAGRYQDAIRLLKKALHLHPHYPPWYSMMLGKAYTEFQQYDAALLAFSDVLERAPHQYWGHTGAAVACMRMGKQQEARRHVSKALALDPGLTIERFAAGDRFHKDPGTLQRILGDLRRAGLEDQP